jgi:integrase
VPRTSTESSTGQRSRTVLIAGTINGSFRKTVATFIDDEGLSARIGADHLGHTHVSMPQDRYMARGHVHTQVANLLGQHTWR